MEKNHKGIKLCIFGGCAALALAGTMILCKPSNDKVMQPQESNSLAANLDEGVTKKVMRGTIKEYRYVDDKGNPVQEPICREVPIYEEIKVYDKVR